MPHKKRDILRHVCDELCAEACDEWKAVLTHIKIDMPVTMATLRWHVADSKLLEGALSMQLPKLKALVKTPIDADDARLVETFELASRYVEAFASYRDDSRCKCDMDLEPVAEGAHEAWSSEKGKQALRHICAIVASNEGMRGIASACLGRCAVRFNGKRLWVIVNSN